MTVAEAIRCAAVCPQCGAKLWPPEQMDVHLMLHEVKLQQYRHTLGKLKWAIDRMRAEN